MVNHMKIDTITDVQQIADELTRNREDIEALEKRIAVLELSRSPHSAFDSCLVTEEFSAQLEQVVHVTQEMFGNSDVQIEHDPEDPETSFVVVSVTVSAQPTEMVARRIEWHKRLRSLTADKSGLFRLSMIPVE